MGSAVKESVATRDLMNRGAELIRASLFGTLNGVTGSDRR
jgi:hypothetical protein